MTSVLPPCANHIAIKFYRYENHSVAQTQVRKSRHFSSFFTVTEKPFFVVV